MKKMRILMLVVIATTALQSASGQAQLALGIKGGLNFASLSASSSIGENYNNRTGYHAGAFLLVKFAKFGIQPEIIYSQQGSTVKFNAQDLDQNFSYVNIPVMAKLYLIGGLNLQAGPQFGFLSKASSETYNPLTGAKSTVDVKDKLKGSDISIGLGAGWDLPFGLTVDARYNLGVSDNNNDNSSSTTKNQVFQVSAGYKLFKFGK